MAAAGLLARQLKQMQSSAPVPGISVGLVNNCIFTWDVMLMVSDDCPLYGGGSFRARLSFPAQYPLRPPALKFTSPIWHPNVYYPGGEVCISILHGAEEGGGGGGSGSGSGSGGGWGQADDDYDGGDGGDPSGYLEAGERWSPVQTPETVLLSVLSMLASPNDESPANVEAAKMWRDDRAEFRRRCRRLVRDSLEGCAD